MIDLARETQPAAEAAPAVRRRRSPCPRNREYSRAPGSAAACTALRHRHCSVARSLGMVLGVLIGLIPIRRFCRCRFRAQHCPYLLYFDRLVHKVRRPEHVLDYHRKDRRGFPELKLEQFPNRQSPSCHDRQHYRRLDYGCRGLLVRLSAQEAVVAARHRCNRIRIDRSRKAMRCCWRLTRCASKAQSIARQ
jgi:hypothetical protein